MRHYQQAVYGCVECVAHLDQKIERKQNGRIVASAALKTHIFHSDAVFGVPGRL